MTRIVIFNKPFQVLSQFRETENKVTLGRYFDDPALRVAGRLDYDSEGLLLLSDNGKLIQQITHPNHKMAKTYFVQVEGEPDAASIDHLCSGVTLKDRVTRPAKVEPVDAPDWLWERNPPIRQRASIPTSWLKLTIREGRNRQVRRMTAAVGFPTLRLIRKKVGEWDLANLQPGQSRILES